MVIIIKFDNYNRKASTAEKLREKKELGKWIKTKLDLILVSIHFLK